MNFAILLCLVLASCALQLDGRIWTDTTGREVEGTWVGSDSEKITLRLSTGKLVTFPLARLTQADRDFASMQAAKQWHPADWKPLRVRMEHIEERPWAVAMPGAFHRIDSHTWEADLPPGAWVKIDAAGGAFGTMSHLFRWDGAREWHFETEGPFLYRGTDENDDPKLVGVAIGSGGGISVLSQPSRQRFHELLGEVGQIESVSGLMLYDIGPMVGLLQKLNPVAVSVQVGHRNDFSDLARLNRLKALHFHVGQIQSFDGLNDLAGIECLDTGRAFTSTLNDAEVLRPFRRLRFLQTSMRGNADVSALGELAGLEALELKCHEPKSVEALGQLPRLHSLGGFTTTSSLIHRLPNLVRLGCRIDEKVDDGASLQLSKITSLRFASVDQISAWKRAGGLGSLHEVENLTGDLGALADMGSLRHVGLSAFGRGGHTGHGGASTLRTLHLKGDPAMAQAVLKSQDSLHGLHVEVWTGPADFQKLGTLRELRWLSLSKVPELASLDGIKGFGTLSLLTLEKLDGLEDVSELASLQELKGLELELLPKLERLSFAGLRELTDVRMTGLKRVEEVQQVSSAMALRRANINSCQILSEWSGWKNLSKLEEFFLASPGKPMDLEPILDVSSIRQVDLVGVKLSDRQRMKLFERTGDQLLKRAEAAVK